MHDLAVEKVGDGCKADMRMRADVDAATGEGDPRGSDLIEENEGADHLPLRRWQGAAHLEAARGHGRAE